MDNVQNVPSEYDFDIWYKTYDPDFLNINIKSRVPQKWLNFQYVLMDQEYRESIVKPINGYSKNFVAPPKLISIDSDTVTLRQYSHAEFYLLDKGYEVITRDRPWVRQYYRSSKPLDRPADCFEGLYAFYMPWTIDSNIEAVVKQPSEMSPFHVFEQSVTMKKIDTMTNYLSSPLINFYFKRTGAHMIDGSYGRIKTGTPLFDIVFKADKDTIQKIREAYENNKVLSI